MTGDVGMKLTMSKDFSDKREAEEMDWYFS